MPRITISALAMDFPAGEGASIQKYFRNALKLKPAISTIEKTKTSLQGSLKEAELDQIRVGFSVQDDIDVGDANTAWTIGVSSSNGLRLWNKEGQTVLSGDDFGESEELKLPAGEAYVGFDFQGTLRSGLSHRLGNLSFGLAAQAGISAANYRPFPSSQPFRKALEETLAGFVIPAGLDDLKALPQGTVAAVGGKGSLKFSVRGRKAGSAASLTTNLPVVDKPVTFNSAFSVGVGASAEYSGEYDVRVRWVDEGTVTLGYYRKRASQFSIAVSASAGASVSVAGQEITTRILAQIAGKPKVDDEFLSNAGLGSDKIVELKKVVSGGLDVSLQASLKLGWGRLSSNEAAFLFTIELDTLDDAGEKAVLKALGGDLRPLTAEEPLAGVTLSRSVVRETLKTSRSIRLNFFGLFNYVSIFDLIREGQVIYDESTGDIQFLDEATAKSHKAWIKPHRGVETEKVRQLVSETVILSHAYSALKKERTLGLSHQYFEYQAKTGRGAAKDLFDVPAALSFIDRQGADRLAGEVGPGRSALSAEARYDNRESLSLFYVDGDPAKPRRRDEYDQTGRDALVRLESGDADDSFRAVLGSNDDLFAMLKDAGSPSEARFQLSKIRVNGRKLSDPQIEAVFSDYITVRWWSEAMVEVGESLKKVLDYEAGAPNKDALAEDEEYKKLREDLRDDSAKVARRATAKFGEPWGLVAMYLVGHPKEASVQITTDSKIYRYPET